MPLYGIGWAEEVLEAFWERYTRGCNEVAKLAGLSPSGLFARALSLVRSDQRRWEIFKRMVKSAELSPPHQLSGREGRRYGTLLWYIATDEWLDRCEDTDLQRQFDFADPVDTPLTKSQTN